MITSQYVRGFSAYNAEMNRRVYDAAARLSDGDRKLDRGAFFGSIHRTLNHLIWADTMWMSRFDGWEPPPRRDGRTDNLFDDFTPMRARRIEMDGAIQAWAAGLADEWLTGDLTWYSGIAQREMTARLAVTVAHMFNHQTHHRGQVHAMLTAAGEDTGATDLQAVLPPSAFD